MCSIETHFLSYKPPIGAVFFDLMHGGEEEPNRNDV